MDRSARADETPHGNAGNDPGPEFLLAPGQGDGTLGARVQEVAPGSAGDDAGLKKDDLITAVNGHAVASNDALVASILAYQPYGVPGLLVADLDLAEATGLLASRLKPCD